MRFLVPLDTTNGVFELIASILRTYVWSFLSTRPSYLYDLNSNINLKLEARITALSSSYIYSNFKRTISPTKNPSILRLTHMRHTDSYAIWKKYHRVLVSFIAVYFIVSDTNTRYHQYQYLSLSLGSLN